MRKALLLAAMLAVGGAPTAWAQDSAPPAGGEAAAEGVDYLVGHWLAAAQDPGSGETVQVDYRVERLDGGPWISGSGKARDGSLSSRDVWGRGPLSGEIVRIIFDASGVFATLRSPGWRGEALVLEGEARSRGGTVRVRETITRQGPDRFRAVWEAHREGRWAPYSIETVTRVG